MSHESSVSRRATNDASRQALAHRQSLRVCRAVVMTRKQRSLFLLVRFLSTTSTSMLASENSGKVTQSTEHGNNSNTFVRLGLGLLF
jgi:hypothetical protein